MAAQFAQLFARVHDERADAVLSSVFAHLPAEQLARCLVVCRYWRNVGRGQEIWRPLCEARWADKVYVPDRFAARAVTDAHGAYIAAELDARRTHITRDELCAFMWQTRMKASSGPGWTTVDPWWNGRAPRTRRFYADGGVDFREERGGERLSASPDDAASADLSVIVHTGRWRFLRHAPGVSTLAHVAGAPEQPVGADASVEDGGAAAPAAAPSAPSSVAARARAGASCMLRMSLGEREFPTMVFARASNWGFVMHNCWGLAASFALPQRGMCAELDDAGEMLKAVTVEAQRLEAAAFNAGLPLPNPPGCYSDEGTAAENAGGLGAVNYVNIVLAGQPHLVPQVRGARAWRGPAALPRSLTRPPRPCARRTRLPAPRHAQHLIAQFIAAHQGELEEEEGEQDDAQPWGGAGGAVHAEQMLVDDDSGDGELLDDDSESESPLVVEL